MEQSDVFATRRRAERPSLAVSLAHGQSDILEAQRLRYRVFAGEMGAKLPSRIPGVDHDVYDPHCDHLIVRDKRSGDVVGTYRILPPERARQIGYYSENEFDLTRLQHLRSRLVEIGRSCVHPEYRSGATITLLWAGLAQYMTERGYDYLMGCASISMADGGHIAASLYQRLAADHLGPQEYRVFPRCPLPLAALQQDRPAETPPLIKGYLRAGAWICGEPAWDPDFNTADPDADGQGLRPLRPPLSGTRKLSRTPIWLRLFRISRIALLLLGGAVAGLLLIPACTPAQRLRLKRDWSGALLDAFGVTIEADLSHAVPGVLIIANHISWLDVFVINALLPSAFVAKEDIRAWPLFGWLAAKNDTIFLRRGSRGHARTINAAVAEILASGRDVAVFPEGTTTDGCSLLHFHAALIQPALAAGRPVLPVAISYWDEEGNRSLAPRYDGDISLGTCVAAILSQRRLRARLLTTPLLGKQGEDRKQLARTAREAIASAAGLPTANTEPETPPGLPAAPQ